MRSFLAVDLGRETTRAVARERPALEAALGGSKVTWTAPETMHLTLHFLGEISEDTLDALRGSLSAPLVTPTFELGLGGYGFFPPAERAPARVLWMDVTSGANEMVRLQAELTERVQAAGIETDARDYRPHLTLARFRRPPAARVRTAVTALAPPSIPPCQVDHVRLYESQLSPQGPRHDELARFMLGASR
jgi:2'-5' RNA ligase